MTEAEKKALIDKLSGKKDSLFDSRYSEDNRKWFVRKAIDGLVPQPTTNADFETKTKEFITKATTALKSRLKKGFNTGTLVNKWAIYNDMRSRIQIIYGAIAMYPKFLETAYQGYFDFIVERRFRMVKRMIYFVNPTDERNIFAYTDGLCKDRTVNKNVKTLWTGVVGGSLPFILSSDGKLDPVKSDENIFLPNKKCDKNILPCDPVATILHMDSLLEAKDKTKLLKHLVTEGDHYLKIDHPYEHFGNDEKGAHLSGFITVATSTGTNVEVELGNVSQVLALFKGKGLNETTINNNQFFTINEDFLINMGNDFARVKVTGVNPVTRKIRIQQLNKSFPVGSKIYWDGLTFPPFHFLTDSRPNNALFEQTVISINDLQVGDHVYVRNHPLYGLFYPTGAWGGEHSFVIEIGDRNISTSGSPFDGSLLVAGHGLSYSIIDMGNDMLSWINTALSASAEVIKTHINYLKTNGYVDSADVKIITKTETTPDGTFTYKYFEYNKILLYKDYRTGGFESIPAFVLVEGAADPKSVLVTNLESKDSSKPDTSHIQIDFIGSNFTTERYKYGKWGVKFFNTEKARFESIPLFEKDDITEKKLDFNVLKQSGPFSKLNITGDFLVTRPRVDFSPTYQQFLKDKGAIPL